jgi:hypothetical protein
MFSAKADTTLATCTRKFCVSWQEKLCKLQAGKKNGAWIKIVQALWLEVRTFVALRSGARSRLG